VPDIAAPLVTRDGHAPGASFEVSTLDGLPDVGAALGKLDGPVRAVAAVLEVQRDRVAADRDADVIDGRDEIVELRAGEGAGFDDFTPAAEVAGFDAVGDQAA
jgi:hypothetical protein